MICFQPLDLGKDISTLASKEIRLEHRILFRLDLPNRKPIGVKAKPGKTVRDVFKPVLNKYGCKVDNMVVHMVSTPITQMEMVIFKGAFQRVAVRPSIHKWGWGGALSTTTIVQCSAEAHLALHLFSLNSQSRKRTVTRSLRKNSL